ncbi:hypothetical protein PAXRUDRAFT_353264 [Paxillus rubicundulus Ve08.2h10]|uniref:Uncharacterized protein n=1 Tax=Paxillus rubicundulus Ve08.2h10 TaxID=930991 RepID=A0A0D0D315_9AGAM|nr:hypothetical protein PAXRUDRAFT_353264 [Paxillus rubicundulus Ve08.2h10]
MVQVHDPLSLTLESLKACSANGRLEKCSAPVTLLNDLHRQHEKTPGATPGVLSPGPQQRCSNVMNGETAQGHITSSPFGGKL